MKEGKVKPSLNKSGLQMSVVDLPGAYSISPYTKEESVTRDYITNERPDVIVNIVDSTNLSRSIFFTTQLLELNIPVVIALNKSDLSTKKKTMIDTELLSRLLQCPVVSTISTVSSKNGLEKLVSEAARVSQTKDQEPPKINFSGTKGKKADVRRFEFVNEIVQMVEKREIDSAKQTRQDKADRIIASPWFGIPIFIGVIFVVFSISQAWVGPWLAGILGGWIDAFYGWVQGLMGSGVNPVVSALLLDGIIGGVGAVIGFLPLIMLLFFSLALLEDCGYMARVAVIMDRYFKKIGLSGRSIIPMVIGTGCAVPGIMASRTIKDERQRRTTAMLTPFMPCGAKLPIIALFAGIFFGGQGWIGTSMYFLGIVIIALGGLMIRKMNGDKSKSHFIIELPEYRIPSVKRALLSVMNRSKAFIIKAGTIILICNALVQLLQSFNWQFQVVAASAPEASILASIATPLAVVFIPLGFGLWQFAAAAVTGFIAKENVVGTLAVCFAITNFINVEELSLAGGAAGDVSVVFGIGAVAALSYLVFNLFTPPCFAAIGAMRSEIGSRKWFFGAIGFQLGMGYTLAFLVYQIGTLATTGELGGGFVGGLIAVVCIVGIVSYLMIRGGRKTVAKPAKLSI
ncbi:MAG: ferrous iron transporter B, partial [Clostridia bacterium]|nr:ferrous iron transporter B [Clostridia bacterium]